jgi:hypothetical protein
VYNGTKLALVDLDEGSVEADAPKRVFEDGSVRYPYLWYPNFLRKWSQAMLYTQIQLLASFLLLVDSWSNQQEQKERLDKLHQLAKTLMTTSCWWTTKQKGSMLQMNA